MKVLMHVCCGPCAVYPVQELIGQGHLVTGYFYNPNIHPFLEYRMRMEGAYQMARHFEIPLKIADGYNPEDYFREVTFREKDRCLFCYAIRLHRAAHSAAEEGYDAFTTSLLVSPWQKHDLLRSLGEEAAGEAGITFLYFDWRPGFGAGRRKAKELGLYRQKYCGCLFSERERYEGEALKRG